MYYEITAKGRRYYDVVFGQSFEEQPLRKLLEDKITASAANASNKALLRGFIDRYEDDIIATAQIRIQERYRNIIKVCRDIVATRKTLATQKCEMLKNAENLAEGTKQLAALKDDIRAAQAEADELRDCPCTDERIIIDLYRKLTEPAKNERNPYIKAQIIRTAGMIIAAKCGLQSIGGITKPTDQQDKAEAESVKADNEEVF